MRNVCTTNPTANTLHFHKKFSKLKEEDNQLERGTRKFNTI